MKICFKCNREQELSQFYKHPRMADGHLNKCIACTKQDSKQHRLDHPEYYAQYEAIRSKTDKRKELNKRIHLRWKQQHPERRKAHETLGNAVRDGKIIPQVCWICGDKGEAHHPDYSRPLEVVWLCKTHHEEVHHMVN